jgi:chromosomal replication initiator protein
MDKMTATQQPGDKSEGTASPSLRTPIAAPGASPRPTRPRKVAPTDQGQSQAAPTVAARDVKNWERVQAQLKTKLGPDSHASWFGRCRLEQASKSQILLSVPTNFLKTWISTHYGGMLLELWQGCSEDVLKVDVIVRSAVRAANRPEPAQAVRSSTTQTVASGSHGESGFARNTGGEVPAVAQIVDPGAGTPFALGKNGVASGAAAPLGRFGPGFSGSPLDPSFTFANFVEGASNRMACAAAKAVAEADGAAARFNPLFIHANVGLGKTHLLQAIAWGAKARNAGVKTLYLTAEYFMWRFASAIRDQSALSFKESLRDIDLLLIDDMQFLQGKSIQQEFCHLLNALIDSAKQVVVAADREPSQLESLDERVKSRLRGGVALEIASPELEMRETMLHLRYQEAQMEDPTLDIPDHVLRHVAGKVASSGRDLEGAFNQLLMQHKFSDGPLDAEQIDRMLGHLVQAGEARKVRIEDIQKVVARHFEVTRNDLLSNRRTRVIVRPRQIAMYLSKQLTPRSLPEIGRRFGGRDHTTVLHAVRKIEALAAEDPKLAQEIELLKRLIEELG